MIIFFPLLFQSPLSRFHHSCYRLPHLPYPSLSPPLYFLTLALGREPQGIAQCGRANVMWGLVRTSAIVLPHAPLQRIPTCCSHAPHPPPSLSMSSIIAYKVSSQAIAATRESIPYLSQHYRHPLDSYSPPSYPYPSRHHTPQICHHFCVSTILAPRESQIGQSPHLEKAFTLVVKTLITKHPVSHSQRHPIIYAISSLSALRPPPPLVSLTFFSIFLFLRPS